MDAHTTGHTQLTPPQVSRKLGYFLRHLGEMIVAMMVGMVAAVPILWATFALMPAGVGPTSPEDAFARFAVLISLVVAAAMIVPMVAWMRHRRHSWRITAEMAIAMALPLLPIFLALGVGWIPGSAACGLYCLSMIPAMLVAMLFRIDAYTSHVGHGG